MRKIAIGLLALAGVGGWVLAAALWSRSARAPRPAAPAKSAEPDAATGDGTRGMRRVGRPDGTGGMAYARRHALVVGVNRYERPLAPLSAPARDAAEVANELADRFGFEAVTLLTDTAPTDPPAPGVGVDRVPAVTGAVLRARLAALRDRVGPRDALFVFYAGHGLRDNGRGFLAPADGHPDRPDSLLDLAELAAALRGCDAHHTLLVLDCCYSGAALEPASGVEAAVGELADRDLGAADADNLARVFNRRAFQVITAGSGREVVDDVVTEAQKYAELAALPEFRGHSPFTAVLLSALRGQTGRPDGKLAAADLGYFMNTTLVNDERIGAKQAPRYGALGQGGGEFVFLPARKVLNPRLVAPLYLGGPQYAPLRASAVAALQQFLADQAPGDRLALARSAVPHLARLLRDPGADPRRAAAAALAELATAHAPAAVPELRAAVPDLTALAADPTQPPDLRRPAARALGRLGPYADPAAVAALTDYVKFREAEWRAHLAGVTGRLKIDPDRFRLPDELAEAWDAARVPAPPPPDARPDDRLAYEDARRARQEALTPEALDALVRRHEQGLAWVEQARKLLLEKDVARAKMLLSAALGFQAFGPPLPGPLARANRPVLFPGTPAWDAAARLLREGPHAYPQWATPTPGRARLVALSANGTRAATLGDDGTVRLWDVPTGAGRGRIAPVGGTRNDYLAAGANGRGALSPAGDRISLTEADGSVGVWSVPDGAAVGRPVKVHTSGPNAHAFSPDGRLLAVATDADVLVWDVPAGREVLRAPVEKRATAVAFTPDGTRVVFATGVTLPGKATLHVRPLDGGPGTDHELPLNSVRQMAFAADGTLAVCGLHPGTRETDPGVVLWDVAAGRAGDHLKGHEPFNAGLGLSTEVRAVAHGPDGRALATLGNDGTLRLWERGRADPVRTIRAYGLSPPLAFGPDGGTVVCGGFGQTVRRWDARTGAEVEPAPGHVGGAFAVAPSPDGRWVASAGLDGTVRVWDAGSGALSATLRGSGAPARAVLWLRDGSALVSTGNDGVVRVWDAATRTERRALSGAKKGLLALALSPDGKLLAAAGYDPVIRLWNTDTWEPAGELAGHEARAQVESLAFSPDGAVLVSAAVKLGPADPNGDPSVRFWLVAERKLMDKGVLRRAQAAVAFAPDGSFVTAGVGDEVWWWGPDRKSVRKLAACERFAKAAAYAPDGGLVATAAGAMIQVWDAGTGAELARLSGHADGSTVEAVAFSADGRGLFSAGSDGTVRRWDVSHVRPLKVLAHALPKDEPGAPKAARAAVTALAWVEPGKVLAAAGLDGAVRRWDAAEGRELPAGEMGRPVANRGVNALAASPDRALLAAACADGRVRLWDAATGALVGTCEGLTGEATCVTFAPDGKTLAAGSSTGKLLCWRAADREPVATVPVRGTAVNGVAFSPDGKTLAAAVQGVGRGAYLYDWAAGKELAELRSPGGATPASFVRYSADGKTLAVGWLDRVSLWDTGGAAVRAFAEVDLDLQRASAEAVGGELVVAARGGLLVLDGATARPVLVRADFPAPVRALAPFPDGDRAAVALGDGTVQLVALPRPPALVWWRGHADLSDNRLRWRPPPAGDRLFPDPAR